MSVKETVERCQHKVTCPCTMQNLWSWGQKAEKVVIVWLLFWVFSPLRYQKKWQCFWASIILQMFKLYLIEHLSVVENECSVAQDHCMRLSMLKTSCSWYRSFTAAALFLIWLHASCFTDCKLTRMTASKLAYIAIKNVASYSVSFPSTKSSENIWENRIAHHHCACIMLKCSEGNKLNFSHSFTWCV